MYDKSIIQKHYDMVLSHYPNINLEQLGLVMVILCSLRTSMGHENVRGTINDYIHKDDLSLAVRDCIDFLEREILAIRKSKIDYEKAKAKKIRAALGIDYWKKGNTSQWRPE